MALTIAQADTRYLNRDQYILDRHRQDDLLRAEFLNQRSLIEGGLERLDGELVDVKNGLERLDGELVDVKNDIRTLKVDMDEVKARLDRFDKRKMNSGAYLPWHKLTPIGVYVPGIGFRTPAYFPKTARSFWKLRSPRDANDLEHLIYLTKSYDVHGFRYWGKENMEDIQSDDDSDSDSDSNEAARQDQLLRNAVREYPLMAWEEVASRIGVKEDKFNRFYERATELAPRPQLPVTKRQPEKVDVGDTGVTKQPRSRLELHELLLDDLGSPRRPSTTSEPSARVRWATPSIAVRTRENLLRRMRDNQSLPRSLSDHPSDSPTELLGSVDEALKSQDSPSMKESKPAELH